MEKTYYTIYKITNQIDGKIYIGSHKTKNLNDNYMGSGKYLKHAQTKYGIDNFTREVMFVFDTPEEMYAKEAELVTEEFISTENTYNLKVGGYGGWDFVNDHPSIVEWRRKGNIGAAKANRGRIVSEETRSKISAALQGRDPVHTKGFSGKTHTQETKDRVGRQNSIRQQGTNNSQYGTVWITDGRTNTKVPKDSLIPAGWRLGRVLKKHHIKAL